VLVIYNIRYCIICGKEIIKTKWDSIKKYENKKTCSYECRGIYLKNINTKDLTGLKFGKLTVIEKSLKRTNTGFILWLCECDCGNKINVAGGDLTRKKDGTKSCGKCPINTYIRQDNYWIGTDCKGKEFIFDEVDYEFIIKHTWNIDNKGYAVTTIEDKKLSLHRMIMDVYDKKVKVDHIDRKRNNNRRYNLRVCTLRKNLWNKGKKEDREYTSKYIGVCWNIKKEKWIANIRILNGKQKHLGEFIKEKDAAKAYDKKCIEIRGDFAVLNFPEDKDKYLNQLGLINALEDAEGMFDEE